jgi:hypothetical protein
LNFQSWLKRQTEMVNVKNKSQFYSCLIEPVSLSAFTLEQQHYCQLFHLVHCTAVQYLHPFLEENWAVHMRIWLNNMLCMVKFLYLWPRSVICCIKCQMHIQCTFSLWKVVY